MTPVAQFLVSIAGIFLIGACGEVVFRRTSVPDVVWLILAGILLGPVGGIVTREQLGTIAPYFAALTIVIVLFEGGSRLKLAEVSSAAPRSGLLALLTFGFAVVVLAAVSMLSAKVGLLPDAWTWRHGLLLGAILGGSSSIIIMPAMAQAKVEPKVANLVGLESAFTDAFCVVGASALINMMVPGASADGSPAAALTSSLGIGLAYGAGAGAIWLLLLSLLKGSDHAYPVTLAALLGLYVWIEHAGGSAALGILTFAVIVGNAGAIGSALGMSRDLDLGTDVRGVHSQITFIVKSFFFTFIGAMLGPPWSVLVFGMVLGGVLLAARIPAVFAAALGSDLGADQKKLVVVALPRGMAAGVLATLPVAAGVPGTETLPTLVFASVLTSILIFSVGFPLVRRRSAAPAGVPVPATTVVADAAALSATVTAVAQPDGETPVHPAGS
jgi:potassium/hydrogen antiporter